jgi:glycosyltransferase involved in cell wall biosynthesis
MILKDEEDTIERCLKCVKDIADEIIIVDTGSKDNTKSICHKYTDNIFDFEWIDDFSVARNYSFSKATKDYILWLDADDVLLKEDREKLMGLKNILEVSVDSVTMKYNLGVDEYGNPALSYRRNRLVKRSNDFKWCGAVHECIEVGGKIINSDVCITHKKEKVAESERNLNIFRRRLERGEEFIPRDVLYYANELYEHNYFEEGIKNYKNFLDMNGWVEDKINVCGKLSDYYSNNGDLVEAKNYVFKCFEYDTPRAEACCRIGLVFLKENKINEATFWYELATQVKRPKDSWGFFDDACWTWLPHLQLCVCYDRLGNYKLALEHNKEAGKYRPNDSRILYNKKYFKDKGYI